MHAHLNISALKTHKIDDHKVHSLSQNNLSQNSHEKNEYLNLKENIDSALNVLYANVDSSIKKLNEKF